MIVGILKEIKPEENRVAMTPSGVEVMRQNGHQVLVEKSAGAGSGFTDEVYASAGADIVSTGITGYRRARVEGGLYFFTAQRTVAGTVVERLAGTIRVFKRRQLFLL